MGNKYEASASVCMYCGERTKNHALICKRCRDAGNRPTRPKTDNERRIAILNAKARRLNLSYGQAVSLYGEMGIGEAVETLEAGFPLRIVHMLPMMTAEERSAIKAVVQRARGRKNQQ